MDFSLSLRLGVADEPGFCVLVFVPAGVVRADAGGHAMTLTAGSLLLAPPGSTPRVAGKGFAAVSFGRSLVAAVNDGLLGEVARILSGTAAAVKLPVADAREAEALFAGIRREMDEARELWPAVTRLKVLELLVLFARHSVVRPGGGERLPRVDEVRHFLDSHYADEVSVTDLAARFGVHPASLSRAFRRETGSTLTDYLNQLRIQKSCELLKRSRSTILEISLFVGFHSLSHFNQIFRRVTGVSPREYRNLAQR